MKLVFEEKKFRLHGKSSLLGSITLDKQLYTTYVDKVLKKKYDQTTRSEIMSAEDLESAYADTEDVPDLDKETTGFYRDANGGLIMKAYQIKGFLKEASGALKDMFNLTSYIKKVDNFVFILEDEIPIMRDGKQLTESDGFLERPLRANTLQGPRVALARSEEITGDWYVDVTIKVLMNNSTAKGQKFDMELIENLLSYGELKGLLQWRNGGHGSFSYEEIESDI